MHLGESQSATFVRIESLGVPFGPPIKYKPRALDIDLNYNVDR